MQKRLNVAMICLIVLLLCLTPALTGQNTGLAQNAETIQADSPLPEPDPIITSYAKDFGVSYAEAERRLILQNEMDNLESKIIEGETTYAGSWTQHQPIFGFVVAFTSQDGEAIIRKYLNGIEWAALVSVQQSRYTIVELDNILTKVSQAAQETKIPFESGSNYRTGKVNIYTPQPETLRNLLNAVDAIKPYVNDIDLMYQESMSGPAQLKYPYLLGGHGVSTCTTGFVVKRNTDNRRFMATAGHCFNNMSVEYDGVASVYLGPIVFENDPENNVGAYGDDIDLQVHDSSMARSFDLTNVIRTGSTNTEKVIATENKATTLNDYVCKHGRVTGQTCGLVSNITYAPGGVYGASDDYVRVDKIAGAIGDMACPSDSGSPVYKYVVGGVWGLGILSGREAVPCTGNNVDWFIYTPVDEITRAGFSILTSHYQQRYRQNVFWTETTCTEYVQAYDDNGNPTGSQTNSPCSTIAAPGTSSETIQTYTAYVMGNFWREGMWRNDKGYTRNVPLNNDGTINWGAAPAWTQCCGPQTAPRSQDAYIIGNTWYQNVYWTEADCKEYKRALDNNGNPTGATTVQNCRTILPAGSSLTINSYTAYPVGGALREGIWRNGIGYVRTVPLIATNTDVDWNNAPAWTQCCSGTPPRAQGGYVLSYP